MAKNLSVPVVALSQLSRNVDQRPIKRPCLADLRESGDLEQDADIVAFIYRDEVYNPETTQHQGIAEVNVAKNRNGKTGMVRMIFQGQYCRFLDAARGAYAGAGNSSEGVLL
jgi:replicative DNA helicase